jgi:two-component system chemotaxis response regulator CheB
MKRSSVLIVDDSPTMRALISASLSRDPALIVVGEAADPFEARDAIKRLDPDVVTLDIEMPKMNGLEFLERIMRLRPTPVVVVSSLTEKGTTTTIRALEMGAVDCVSKPSSKNPKSFEALGATVAAAARAHMHGRARPSRNMDAAEQTFERYACDGRIVAIGSSMGGVEALCVVLQAFPEACPPTIITQHMPAMFTRSLAERLDRLCKPQVREATDGAPLVSGCVYLAPGGEAHLEVSGSKHPQCRLRAGEPESGHRPSIDAMFKSAARAVGGNALGVILTGMGRDGAEGLLAMRHAGADTIGQDEATSLVYGMPRAAFEIGAVRRQAPLRSIGAQILEATNSAKARQTWR